MTLYTDQLFGVPLEEFSKAYKSPVPPLISQGLAAIDSGFSHIYKEGLYILKYILNDRYLFAEDR